MTGKCFGKSCRYNPIQLLGVPMATDPQLRELQLVFIDEAKQFLEEAEETLLELEASGFQTELVNKAFRLAHNFKGSSRSVGFSELGKLAHKYEDILSAVKSGVKPLSPAVITALLGCNDTLKQEIKAYQSDENHSPNIEDALRALDQIDIKESIHKESIHPPVESKAQEPSNTKPTEAEKMKDMLARGWGLFEENLQTLPRHAKKANQKPKNQAQSAQASDESLKIPAKRLDALLNIIGELVVNQSILDDCRQKDLLRSDISMQAISYMSKLIADIQNLSLSLRLVPIKPLFQKLRRTARDVASEIGKEINFIDEGDYCELDKNVIERIADPLNHMIRNAVDHGVDTKDERLKAGKSELATVKLSAVTLDDQVKIIVSDDGRGLDSAKILAKAKANNLVSEADDLTDPEIYSLIFAPGFSTKDKVTDVSGRGVGMEVVQKAVDDLKGSISIDSTLGKGTTFEISIPLSLSIIGGMVIQANGQKFIVPVSQLVETVELSKAATETVTGTSRTLNLRGDIVPSLNLSQILSRRMQKPQTQTSGDETKISRPALITHYRGKKVSFEVEEIISQQKVVLKHLGPEFEGIPGIVAGAILSNGEPGLVLSLDQLAAGA